MKSLRLFLLYVVATATLILGFVLFCSLSHAATELSADCVDVTGELEMGNVLAVPDSLRYLAIQYNCNGAIDKAYDPLVIRFGAPGNSDFPIPPNQTVWFDLGQFSGTEISFPIKPAELHGKLIICGWTNGIPRRIVDPALIPWNPPVQEGWKGK